MMSKSFLSGIFSVVSFIFISNLAIPSTFAQCPPDVSGKWVFKGVKVQECCSNPNDNGTKIFSGSVVVMQTGNEISASWAWVDGHGTDVLTGIVNGNSVYCKIVGTESGNPSCGGVSHIVGIIINKGTRIKLYASGADNTGCGTCKVHLTGTAKIVK